jgi:hypothetical protein
MPPILAQLIDSTQETYLDKHFFSFDGPFALAKTHLHDRRDTLHGYVLHLPHW